jgi:hypothetical protein
MFGVGFIFVFVTTKPSNQTIRKVWFGQLVLKFDLKWTISSLNFL